jgi:hypothetical protein
LCQKFKYNEALHEDRDGLEVSEAEERWEKEVVITLLIFIQTNSKKMNACKSQYTKNKVVFSQVNAPMREV